MSQQVHLRVLSTALDHLIGQHWVFLSAEELGSQLDALRSTMFRDGLLGEDRS